MKTSIGQYRVSLAIRILSVFALMFVAFAHKPVDLNALDSYQLAQYKLPDGTYPVLCIGDHSSDPSQKDHDKHLSNTSCEACRISSAFLCPAPAGSSSAVPHIAMADGIVPPQPILRHSTYPPSAPPQAPPLA
ncbi:hypothetical protein [Brucella sp. LJL56]